MEKASDPAPAAVPRDRDEASYVAAFCLTFGLARSESGVLVKILMQDYGSREELRIAASVFPGHATTDKNVMKVVHDLRRKLRPHGIEIHTVRRLGYGLNNDARRKIRNFLARYDRSFMLQPAGKAAAAHVS